MSAHDVKTTNVADDNSSAESADKSVESILSEAGAGPENPVDPQREKEGKREAAEAKKSLSKEDLKPDVSRPALYVATEGADGRDGGPYLDREQRREQELINARREGREPDFKNPALAPSTVLVTETQLRAQVDREVTVDAAFAAVK